MMDLIVERLHARATIGRADDEARVHALLADLAGRRMEEALASLSLPSGEWFVRRLDVALRLDAASGDASMGRQWARSVTDCLAGAIAAGGPDVVHYPRPADAVTDVIAALAVGRLDRRWAWRAVGALTNSDPDPAVNPSGAALAVLAHDPRSAVHALGAAVTRAGLPAVHRLLGAAGWRRAAAIVLTASEQSVEHWLGANRGADPGVSSGLGSGGGSARSDVDGDAVRAIIAGIAARSSFAAAWRRSRLRPDAATGHAWAVLAAIEAEPALLRRPVAVRVLALLPTSVDPTATTPAVAAGCTTVDRSLSGARDVAAAPVGAAGRVGPAAPQAQPEAAGSRVAGIETHPPIALAEHADGDAPGPARSDRPVGADNEPDPMPTAPRPDRARESAAETVTPRPPSTPEPRAIPEAPAPQANTPSGDPEHATVWGGLVYLLATADAAGVPDDLFTDNELGSQPAPWILFHLIRALTGDAPDSLHDPAVRALAGLPPDSPVPEPAPSPAQHARLRRHADDWARATTERIGAAEEPDPAPRDVVIRITARAGTVTFSPSWSEFHLRLSDVDLDVRRAGLDLDPGFVAWLGAVVVIRYE